MKLEPGHLLALLIYPLSALLIFTTIHGEDGVGKRLLLSGPALGLGALSYSLYMWHYLIIWTVDNLTPHLASRFASLGVLHAVQYVTVIATTLLISYCSYHFVEQPWRMKSRAKAVTWFDRAPASTPSIIH